MKRNKFLFRDNLDWISKATNWNKFNAVASLGLIHRVSRYFHTVLASMLDWLLLLGDKKRSLSVNKFGWLHMKLIALFDIYVVNKCALWENVLMTRYYGFSIRWDIISVFDVRC